MVQSIYSALKQQTLPDLERPRSICDTPHGETVRNQQGTTPAGHWILPVAVSAIQHNLFPQLVCFGFNKVITRHPSNCFNAIQTYLHFNSTIFKLRYFCHLLLNVDNASGCKGAFLPCDMGYMSIGHVLLSDLLSDTPFLRHSAGKTSALVQSLRILELLKQCTASILFAKCNHVRVDCIEMTNATLSLNSPHQMVLA